MGLRRGLRRWLERRRGGGGKGKETLRTKRKKGGEGKEEGGQTSALTREFIEKNKKSTREKKKKERRKNFPIKIIFGILLGDKIGWEKRKGLQKGSSPGGGGGAEKGGGNQKLQDLLSFDAIRREGGKGKGIRQYPVRKKKEREVAGFFQPLVRERNCEKRPTVKSRRERREAKKRGGGRSP